MNIGIKHKLFTICLVILFVAADILFSGPIYKYKGISFCAECHTNDSIGNQIEIWEKAPHSKAYKSLQTDAAVSIAAKYNISNPSENLKCLECHTTGAGKFNALKEEGVGCEACHGPAEGYGSFENHASFTDRENAYIKAVKYGMYPIIGINHIKNREKLCHRCHSTDPAKRLCLPESLEKRKEDVLSLDVIANFIYRHPVVR